MNIIVFAKNHNFLDAAFDQVDPAAEQVGVTPVVAHDLLSKEYTVNEEGYVFMYIANENATQVDAYFDDVAMTYTPTNIVQYNEYYPFGLQASTSWTRDNNTNNFLYNEGSELNAESGWYETPFRGYDAALGRFMQVDPLAHMDHSSSPFAYAGDNPILFNDPSGLLKATKQEINRFIDTSPYGGLSFSGEAYNFKDTWLHLRLDEKFIDYAAVRSRQLDELQDIFDNWGAVPGFGEVFDLFNAGISSARGNYSRASFSAAAMIPIAGWIATGGKIGKKALSNVDLVQKAATKAEAAIGGIGGVAGTYKHQYANALLNRYQNMYGSRGLLTNFSFNNGPGNRGFLDVIDHANKIIYDYKFGNAVMSNTQFNKYSNNFVGYSIQIIRP